jgi:hypothetical protein
VALISVDLAYKRHTDIGIVTLRRVDGRIRCELISPALLDGLDPPRPAQLALALHRLAEANHISALMIDGPQAWKSASSGLQHSRICERLLNTPAKTGVPGFVKPGNYRPFVEFSISVFDALIAHGWTRFEPSLHARSVPCTVIESFPLAAWRSLKLAPLPSKRKATPVHIANAVASLRTRFPLDIFGTPNHDEAQALVAGLGGLAWVTGHPDAYVTVGAPPFCDDGRWREGWIVNPV